MNLCLTDRVWVNRPKRTTNHERLCIHETAGTPSVTLTVVVASTLLCNDCRVVRVSLPEPVLGLLFFFGGGDVALVHTYLHIRILGAELRYVRMWYIIRHTKTKRSRTRVHACTRHACTRHTRRLFFWDVSIRNSLRSNKHPLRDDWGSRVSPHLLTGGRSHTLQGKYSVGKISSKPLHRHV